MTNNNNIKKLPSLLLSSLIQANKAILSQKLSLINILESKYGIDQLPKYFVKSCPIVKASIGQHYRHSMDHIELATLVASTYTHNHTRKYANKNHDDISVLRYDLRVRGGTLETDVTEATKRINSVIQVLDDIIVNSQTNNNCNHRIVNHEYNDNYTNFPTSFSSPLSEDTTRSCITSEKVTAAFMLSSSNYNATDNNYENDGEMELESTIGRELGFCSHHAIHHMAMVKIIAVQSLGVEEHELPVDFGKAPSTIRFENNAD